MGRVSVTVANLSHSVGSLLVRSACISDADKAELVDVNESEHDSPSQS